MMFGVLGSLQVMPGDADEPCEISAARLRVLLAVLLWRANQPVPVDELAELVWDGTPPSGAPEAIRALVMRLRRRLGSRAAARIVTRTSGYAIEISDAELDASRFETLSQEAGAAVRAGQWAEAVRAAAGALGLWRGTPLADIPSQRLRDRWVPHLEQLHLQALEWRIEADLHEGSHEQLIPELRNLTAHHPLREHFRGQLMFALARSGRRAEALAAYHDARGVLVAELGVEPGPGLRDLHERILAGDSEPLTPLGAPARSESTSRPLPPSEVPRQLPAAVRHFVGREGELKALSELLTQQAGPGGAVVISAIGGSAGIGKTALAVHWAHLHADRFPHGQLYVNLRGFDPSGTPVPPAEAVRRLLDALGVPAQRVPADPDEQAALYRSQLAGRRTLIVLDNARDAGQVRPLLPGSPGSLVLVTSRSQLADLVALDGAVPLTLDLLTHGEARDLLVGRLGRDRVTVDEHTVTGLIEVCARLPLALNIAAARAAFYPARRLAEFVEELRDVRRRLDAFTIGEGAADVRAVFSWSYRTLDPEAARVFRLLGVYPGPDISLPATASLTALGADRTRRALDELTRAHLLTEYAPGRYSFHDLLRVYAAEQAHAHDSQTERQDALRRICDHYTRTAYAADRLLEPHRPPLELDPPAPGTRTRPLADVPAALAWLDVEHPNLLAVQRTAAANAWHSAVWQLAWTVETFHRRRGRYHDQFAVWRAALDASAHLPDPAARALAYRLVGRSYADLGHHQEAVEHLHRALKLTEDQHDRTEQAHTHRMLAWAWEKRGDGRQALYHATRCLDLFRALDQPVWEARALNMMGWYCAGLDDYAAARAHCQAALSLHQRHHDPHGEAATFDSLGYIDHRTGHQHRAIDYYQQSIALCRSTGYTLGSANGLDHLGHPHAALDEHEKARAVWRQALELYRQQGHTEDADRVQRQLDLLDRPGGM